MKVITTVSKEPQAVSRRPECLWLFLSRRNDLDHHSEDVPLDGCCQVGARPSRADLKVSKSTGYLKHPQSPTAACKCGFPADVLPTPQYLAVYQGVGNF